VQHQNRLGAAAEHEVGLPVAERLATQHRLGSIVDRAAIGDGALGFATFAPAAPRLAARQQLPELLHLLPGTINKAINGLRAEPAQARLVAGLEPSRARRPRDPSAKQPWSGDRGGPAICSGDQPSLRRSTTKRSSRSRRAKYDPSAKLGW
jgi:hypothetical protein